MDGRGPAVFLDRDGILNEVVRRGGRAASPRTAAEFVLAPGIAAELERLRVAGCRLFVVTNQPDIARGKVAAAIVDGFHARLRTALPLDDIALCPHDDKDGCACRKPRPGMLLTLARKWNIALARAFMVGDSWRDMGAGAAAGVSTILVQRDYNTDARGDHNVASVAAAVALIVRTIGSRTMA